MNKSELKDYNRLLRAENEALREILQMAENSIENGCYCKEIALIHEENAELVKALNDLQADWAEDHVKTVNAHEADCALSDTTLQEFERSNENLIEQNERYARNIRELKKEKFDMGMELEKLKKQNENLKMQNENLIEDIETAQKRLNGMAEAQR